MKWEMLSAIGQLAAAAGVIPSLIYTLLKTQHLKAKRGNAEQRRCIWKARLANES